MRVAVLVFLVALCSLVGGGAAADPGDFVIVSQEVTATDGDNGPAFSVAVLNLTDADATASVDRAAECTPEIASDPVVRVGHQATVKVELAECPALDDGEVDVVVTVAHQGASRPFVIAVTRKAPDPNWALLGWIFLTSVLASGTVVALSYLGWRRSRPEHAGKTRGKVAREAVRAVLPLGWLRPWKKTGLPGLTAEWKFKEQWASNVTLAAAAFTAVFGASGGLEPVLGDAGESFFTLVTVTSAIAVGLVGAAPLLVLATKDDKDQVTVPGLLGATFLALAATGAELGVIVVAAVVDLDLGIAGTLLLPVLGVLAVVVLTVYGWRSLRITLAKGIEPPKPKKVRGKGMIEEPDLALYTATSLGDDRPTPYA